TITFPQPEDKRSSDAPFALTATASSGLPVTIAVESGPATIEGGVVTLTGKPGTVTLVASIPEGDTFTAASVTRTFEVTAAEPLTFFGTLTDGSQSVGKLAAHVAADGKTGTLIGFIPGQSAGFVVEFTVNADGTFTATINPLTTQGTPASASTPVAKRPALRTTRYALLATSPSWTFTGQVSGGTITGSIDELALSFDAAVDPIDGPTAPMSGFYELPSLDTTTGRIYSIVGTTGEVYVLAVMPDVVVGESGVLEAASGNFTVQTSSGLMIDGNINAPTTTIDGAVTRPAGGGVTDFSGVVSTATRTDRLVNLSSRGRVGTGERVLITGFAIGGEAPRPVLLRAVGPGLSDLGVSSVLSDPRLRLYQDGAVIAENDNWSASEDAEAIRAAATRLGAFDLAEAGNDAALLITLPPGSYTAQVEGAGAQGVSLAEIYELPE
ncbi:MAG: hypothetical protein ACREIA_13340, partial [Opitutaceae bacterium]